MKMNDTVARIVEIMFQDVVDNEEVEAIRDEVMNNCQERYQDLVNSGVGEDDAVAAVIESLKGMEDVLAPYKRKTHHCAETDEPEDEMLDEDEPCERALTFAASEVYKIDLRLTSEDVTLGASGDDDYHVIWNADETTNLDAKLVNGVLKVEHGSGEQDNGKKAGHVEFDYKNDLADFIKTEAGKIEINMDSFSSAMKSLGKKIRMQFSNGMKMRFGAAGSEVTIQVPENAVPHVTLQTVSGDMDVQDVALTDLKATSTSGDMSIDLREEQYLSQVDLRNTSGDMRINVFADRMGISSTSGDVDVGGCINQLEVGTVSGDIDVCADVKNMNFKTVSGDVDLRFDSEEIRDVRGSTISGDVDIDLPDGIGVIAISTQTRSGDVTTRHHCDGVGPTVTGSVTTMSGDITIS